MFKLMINAIQMKVANYENDRITKNYKAQVSCIVKTKFSPFNGKALLFVKY